MESNDLVTLREELTCPVCLEIPRSGDLFQCYNGHLICQADFNKLSEGSIQAKCPECMAIYGSNPSKNRFAVKFLNLVKIPCRFVDEGCSTELTRKLIEQHETKDCKIGLRPCRYQDNGCQEKVLKNDNVLATKHEEDCDFRPFPCIAMICVQRLTCSQIISHLRDGGHSVDFKRNNGLQNQFTTYFHITEVKSVPLCPDWSQWRGAVFKFDGHHFYLGLIRMGDRWTASVHLIGKPSEVSNYRARITAKNLNNKRRLVTYDGPVNSLIESDCFEKEVMGLNFSNRIIEALKFQDSNKNKTLLCMECNITKDESFSDS